MVSEQKKRVIERYFAPKTVTLAELDETGQRIMRAFRGPDKAWRTAGGIARETGLSLTAVQEYIDAHPEYFIEDTLAGGVIYSSSVQTEGQLIQFPDSHAD